MSSMPLSNKELSKMAPSIFAREPISEVSSKYMFIPTIEVVDVFRGNGWYPVDAKESLSKTDKHIGYQKHLIRFRRLEDLLYPKDDAIEIILTNSHNKSSSFIIKLGVFRFVCANGLVVANSLFKDFSIRHISYNEVKVNSAINEVVSFLPMLENKINLYKHITLSEKEMFALAKSAKDIRFSKSHIVDPMDLLQAKREEDRGDDLWRVFNRIEENCIRGGVRGKNITTGRNFTSKPITNIDKLLKINSSLFELTDKVAQIKLSA